MHIFNRSDIIDMLEESASSGRRIEVELRSNRKFVDHVREVVTRDGEDWAVFRTHEPVAVTRIHSCSRAEPWENTYAGKR